MNDYENIAKKERRDRSWTKTLNGMEIKNRSRECYKKFITHKQLCCCFYDSRMIFISFLCCCCCFSFLNVHVAFFFHLNKTNSSYLYPFTNVTRFSFVLEFLLEGFRFFLAKLLCWMFIVWPYGKIDALMRFYSLF
jgi:hypothetical protein